MRSSGRVVPDQRLRPGLPKRATVPACDLTLRDGHLRRAQPLVAQQAAGPNGETIRIAWWACDDGMRVSASMDATPHGRLLHVALSYADQYPTWEDIKAVRAAFYAPTIDVAMMLPQERDYINIQEFCMQMWQTPVEWGLQ